MGNGGVAGEQQPPPNEKDATSNGATRSRDSRREGVSFTSEEVSFSRKGSSKGSSSTGSSVVLNGGGGGRRGNGRRGDSRDADTPTAGGRRRKKGRASLQYLPPLTPRPQTTVPVSDEPHFSSSTPAIGTDGRSMPSSSLGNGARREDDAPRRSGAGLGQWQKLSTSAGLGNLNSQSKFSRFLQPLEPSSTGQQSVHLGGQDHGNNPLPPRTWTTDQPPGEGGEAAEQPRAAQAAPALPDDGAYGWDFMDEYGDMGVSTGNTETGEGAPAHGASPLRRRDASSTAPGITPPAPPATSASASDGTDLYNLYHWNDESPTAEADGLASSLSPYSTPPRSRENRGPSQANGDARGGGGEGGEEGGGGAGSDGSASSHGYNFSFTSGELWPGLDVAVVVSNSSSGAPRGLPHTSSTSTSSRLLTQKSTSSIALLPSSTFRIGSSRVSNAAGRGFGSSTRGGTSQSPSQRKGQPRNLATENSGNSFLSPSSSSSARRIHPREGLEQRRRPPPPPPPPLVEDRPTSSSSTADAVTGSSLMNREVTNTSPETDLYALPTPPVARARSPVGLPDGGHPRLGDAKQGPQPDTGSSDVPDNLIDANRDDDDDDEGGYDFGDFSDIPRSATVNAHSTTAPAVPEEPPTASPSGFNPPRSVRAILEVACQPLRSLRPVESKGSEDGPATSTTPLLTSKELSPTTSPESEHSSGPHQHNRLAAFKMAITGGSRPSSRNASTRTEPTYTSPSNNNTGGGRVSREGDQDEALPATVTPRATNSPKSPNKPLAVQLGAALKGVANTALSPLRPRSREDEVLRGSTASTGLSAGGVASPSPDGKDGGAVRTTAEAPPARRSPQLPTVRPGLFVGTNTLTVTTTVTGASMTLSSHGMGAGADSTGQSTSSVTPTRQIPVPRAPQLTLPVLSREEEQVPGRRNPLKLPMKATAFTNVPRTDGAKNSPLAAVIPLPKHIAAALASHGGNASPTTSPQDAARAESSSPPSPTTETMAAVTPTAGGGVRPMGDITSPMASYGVTVTPSPVSSPAPPHALGNAAKENGGGGAGQEANAEQRRRRLAERAGAGLPPPLHPDVSEAGFTARRTYNGGGTNADGGTGGTGSVNGAGAMVATGASQMTTVGPLGQKLPPGVSLSMSNPRGMGMNQLGPMRFPNFDQNPNAFRTNVGPPPGQNMHSPWRNATAFHGNPSPGGGVAVVPGELPAGANGGVAGNPANMSPRWQQQHLGLMRHMPVTASATTAFDQSATGTSGGGGGGGGNGVGEGRGANYYSPPGDAEPAPTTSPKSMTAKVGGKSTVTPASSRSGNSSLADVTGSQLGLRRRRRVSFKETLEEILPPTRTLRSSMSSFIQFRNPTIREQGRELMPSLTETEAALLERRQNIHAVAVIDEDAVSEPYLVVGGSSVRVYTEEAEKDEDRVVGTELLRGNPPHSSQHHPNGNRKSTSSDGDHVAFADSPAPAEKSATLVPQPDNGPLKTSGTTPKTIPDGTDPTSEPNAADKGRVTGSDGMVTNASGSSSAGETSTPPTCQGQRSPAPPSGKPIKSGFPRFAESVDRVRNEHVRVGAGTAQSAPDYVSAFDSYRSKYDMDEALSRRSGDVSTTSIALELLQEDWIAGHNVALLLGNSRGRSTASLSVVKNFISSAVETIRQRHQDPGSWAELRMVMGEVVDAPEPESTSSRNRSGGESVTFRDLLASSAGGGEDDSSSSESATRDGNGKQGPASVYLTPSPIFGVVVGGLSTVTVRDDDIEAVQVGLSKGFVRHAISSRTSLSSSFSSVGSMTVGSGLETPTTFVEILLKRVCCGADVPEKLKAANDTHAEGGAADAANGGGAGGAASISSNEDGEHAREEVKLASLVVVFFGADQFPLEHLLSQRKLNAGCHTAANLGGDDDGFAGLANGIALGERKSATKRQWQPRDWADGMDFLSALTQHAIGGRTRTVACACLSDYDKRASGWLRVLQQARVIVNAPPHTGSARAFLGFMRERRVFFRERQELEEQLALWEQAGDVQMALTHRRNERIRARLETMITDLKAFLSNPAIDPPLLAELEMGGNSASTLGEPEGHERQ